MSATGLQLLVGTVIAFVIVTPPSHVPEVPGEPQHVLVRRYR